MAVYLSTFTNKVDRKGRVSFPASFRGALVKAQSDGIILYPSFKHPCIEGCDEQRIEVIVDSIDQLAGFSDDAENLQTILADSQRLAIDGDGRVVLPPNFIEFAQLTDTAMFVGIGRSFQIWSPSEYQKHHDQNRDRARSQNATLRIIQPSQDGGGGT